LLALSIAIPAFANLVPLAGVPLPSQSTPTAVPSPSPSPVPVAAIGNTLSNPVVISSNTALDPVTVATINNTMMNMAWSPVLGSDMSPFRDVSSLGGATVEVQSIDRFAKMRQSTKHISDSMRDKIVFTLIEWRKVLDVSLDKVTIDDLYIAIDKLKNGKSTKGKVYSTNTCGNFIMIMKQFVR
jgi:hypothetical protein